MKKGECLGDIFQDKMAESCENPLPIPQHPFSLALDFTRIAKDKTSQNASTLYSYRSSHRTCEASFSLPDNDGKQSIIES
jgi:hypothetical protein